jgi:hypothetical protein
MILMPLVLAILSQEPQTILALAPELRPADQNQGPNQQRPVRLLRVIKQRDSGSDLFQVSYDYDFRGRRTVYIKNLGVMPASGQLSYLTTDPILDFKESADGVSLATVSVEETNISMAADSTELPREADFSKGLVDGPTMPLENIASAIVEVVQRHFPSGYRPNQVGDVLHYVTTYRTLPIRNSNLRSQIAVDVSQPYLTVGDRARLRVQVAIRDRPRLSDTWRYGDNRNQSTIEAGNALVAQIVEQLRAFAGEKR